MSEKKYAHLINPIRDGLKKLDTSIRPLATGNADEMPITRFVTMEQDIYPETELYQAIHLAEGLTGPQPDLQVYHSHEDFDEMYLLLGNGERFTGLKAEIILEGERHEIDSPATVYIPKKVRHQYKMLAGSGINVITVLKGKYYHTKE